MDCDASLLRTAKSLDGQKIHRSPLALLTDNNRLHPLGWCTA